MEPKDAYDQLLSISKEVTYIESMITLSKWDQNLLMPENGTVYRAKAQAYLSDLKNRKLTDPKFGRLLSIAEKDTDKSLVEQANLRLLKRDYGKRTKMSPDFSARESKLTSLAQDAWQKARQSNNYSIFKPYLKDLIELYSERAQRLGYKDHPYDALLDDNMPGITSDECDRLFESIKPPIINLINRIKRSNVSASSDLFDDFSFPEEKQKEFLKEVTEAIGYDYRSGLLLKTRRHPDTQPIGEGDIRISVRYDESNPLEPATFSAIHEAGHGIYYQRIPRELYGMPVGNPPGLDINEAESRFFENNIGRSLVFWQHFTPVLKEKFGLKAENISPNDLYLFINRLKLGPIRLQADEISYVLHVIIRYEIERDLFGGLITVDDIPAIWKQKYMDYLGVDVPDNISGILQDIHWATPGGFGYFPAYVLGSINAAQMDAAMRRDHPDIDERIAAGDISIPASWMYEHIYKYGSIYEVHDLMRRATGKETDSSDFLKYLNEKYGKLYNLA
ncbi:MAG: carboxypeptidase M32 [Methanotrichaceae archaeon]